MKSDMLPHQAVTARLLLPIYPTFESIPPDEYWALLKLLSPYFAYRALAETISIIYNIDRDDIVADAYQFSSDGGPIRVLDASEECVLEKLRLNGFESWKNEMRDLPV
jgi:hypothetical protein